MAWTVACCALWLAAAAFGQGLEEARALYAAGRWREAAEAFSALAAQTTAPGDRARAHNNACVIFNDLGDHHTALDHCRQALALRRDLEDPSSLARTLNNIGLTLQHLGHTAEAEASFREALAINRQRGQLADQVINLANLGAFTTGLGRFDEAFAFHREAARIARQQGDEAWAPAQEWIAWVNQGVVLERLGAFRQALDLYRQAREEEERVDAQRRASLRVNLGVVYRNLGDPREAVSAFEEAADFYQQLEDTAGLTNALLNLGLAYHLNLARPAAAEDAFQRALAAARRGGNKTAEAQGLCHLGRLYLDHERLTEAEESLRACLAAAQEGTAADSRWPALYGLGRLAAGRGDSSGALTFFARAIDDFEAQRASVEDPGLRSLYLADKQEVYGASVTALADLERQQPGHGHAERALEIVERAKAHELLDALGGKAPATALDAAALAALAGDGLLLEYFVAGERLWGWALRAAGITMRDLGLAAPILEQVAAVHGILAAGATPRPGDLEGLAASLIAPLATLHPAPAHLVVAPDAALRYLPFELLPMPEDGRPLVEVLPVTYAPSVSLLARRDRGQTAALRTLVAVGAPELSPRTDGALRDLLIANFNLQQLPGSALEIDNIAAQLPGDRLLLKGRDATEGALRRAVAGGASILHLASHAVLDERPEGGAAIVLQPSADDDGLLYPREIAAVQMPVVLTVLAACRTAVSGGGSGRALTSLGGAFLAAGSDAVIASLWDIGDAESAVFVEQLYYFLGRGLRPAAALRQAKLRLRNDPDWDRPDLWAAFVLIGDAGPVVTPRQKPWIAWVIGVMLAAGALAVFLLHARSPRPAA